MSDFKLTLAEAEALMQQLTGENWPLQRLVGAGVNAAVWLPTPKGASRELVREVYCGLWSGFAAPVVEGGDLERLAFTRGDGTLTITRRPDGRAIRMEPPAVFTADALRFSEVSLREIGARHVALQDAAPRKGGGRKGVAPDEVAGTRKVWTSERLEELRDFRAAHGTKEAAKWASVSESRVRALLPRNKPATTGYSAFTHRRT